MIVNFRFKRQYKWTVCSNLAVWNECSMSLFRFINLNNVWGMFYEMWPAALINLLAGKCSYPKVNNWMLSPIGHLSVSTLVELILSLQSSGMLAGHKGRDFCADCVPILHGLLFLEYEFPKNNQALTIKVFKHSCLFKNLGSPVALVHVKITLSTRMQVKYS